MDPTKPTFASVGLQMQNPPSMDQSAQYASSVTNEEPPAQFSTEDWAQLLHNLGSGLQQANPDIQNALKSLLGEGVDYQKEAAPLRDAINNRKVTPRAGGVVSTLAGFASPTVAAENQQQNQRNVEETSQKKADMEKLTEDLANKHIADLERKGKFQEGMATLLLTQGLSEARARQRASEMTQREKLRESGVVRAARERATAIANKFNLDDKMRLKFLDIAGHLASQQAARVGQKDSITGEFMVPEDQYGSTMDDIVSNLYDQAEQLRKGGTKLAPPNKAPDKQQEGPKPKLGFAEWKAKQAAGKK